MKGFSLPLGLLYLLSFALTAPVSQAVQLPGQRLIDFPLAGRIKGSEPLMANKPIQLLIGETHGTWEIPTLVAVIVRSISADSPTILCLEIPHSEQGRLNAYLQSDGSDEAISSLTSGPHRSSTDGRAGEGHFALLELTRRLVAKGRQVQIAAFDTDFLDQLPFGKDTISPADVRTIARRRDRSMAENVLGAQAKNPAANVIILAGNVHASLKTGTPWDPAYEPMGWHLKQKLPKLISLNAATSGGRAWVTTEKGSGPTDFAGKDRGDAPFVELFTKVLGGYNGTLYVGSITAAPPIRPHQKRGGTAQR